MERIECLDTDGDTRRLDRVGRKVFQPLRCRKHRTRPCLGLTTIHAIQD